MRVAITGGAYTERSLIADAQRCINLYPEKNAENAAAPWTLYPTPGLTLKTTAPNGKPIRGMYVASNGELFVCAGDTLYCVSSGWNWADLGMLTTSAGPVSMTDNTFTLVLVDGPAGYTVELAGHAFRRITDAGFYGSSRVDYVDGYLVFNQPETQHFYISKFGKVEFDGLDIASKGTANDKLVCCSVMHREVWLFGKTTTEVWYNTGQADFTFGRMPGVMIEQGCIAHASVAVSDLTILWLSQDRQGQRIVMAGKGYQSNRVSTHAIEQEISKYDRVDDAFGFIYQQQGHRFYMLTFPSANRTWCYDMTTGQWHQRGRLGADGSVGRHVANCHAFWNGWNIVGDDSGKLYSLDLDNYSDDGYPILRLRSFAHLPNDGKRVMYKQLLADMECGHGLPDNSPPEIRLRWSDDRGFSWGNPITNDLGRWGEYNASVQFQRLGMARDRVFELAWSAPVKTALQGISIDIATAKS